MTVEQLALFLPAAALVAISPGANNLLAFVTATRVGWRRAAGAIAGRAAAWAALVLLVSFGLDALLRTSELAFVALKWLGVAYLLYLASKFWRAETTPALQAPDTATLARREFLTLLGNPKAYLLSTAFLPQFVLPAAPALPQLLALGGLYLAVEAAAALLWVGAGAILGAHALTPLRRRRFNRASAGLMAIAALLLARTDRAA